MVHETWLLRYGQSNRTVLVVQFSQSDDGRSLAELYDDEDGDGDVAITVSQQRVRIEEASGRARLRVSTERDGWLPEGRPNYNLEIHADGPIAGMIDAPIYLDRLMTDGRVDLSIFVQDHNRNGRPELEWRQSFPPLDKSSGVVRTSVMVSPHDDEYDLELGPLPWPYIAPEVVGLVKPYFFSPPPVQVDWEKARITVVGELVASRGKPDNYFIYSINRLNESIVSTANFEAPFAYYNLGNSDEFPDVAIRHVYDDSSSPFSPSYYAGQSNQQVDLSWRFRRAESGGAPVWDYKVSLAGRHPIDTVYDLGPFRLKGLHYQRLLPWVIEQQWDFATLVAREGPGYPSTEGFYEWYPLEGSEPDGRKFLTGQTGMPPLSRFASIAPGLRAEAGFTLGDQPWLYVSAVDKLLHLRGAEYGVWNVDGQRFLRYRNVAGGPSFDEWALEVDGTASETLRVVGTRLVLETADGLFVKVLERASLGELLPPWSTDSWESLAAVAPERLGVAGFRTPAEVFLAAEGGFLTIPKAHLLAFRQVESGVLAELNVTEATALSDQLRLASHAPIALPGRYILSEDGVLAESPAVVASAVEIQVPGDRPCAGKPSAIRLSLPLSGAPALPKSDVGLRAVRNGVPIAELEPVRISVGVGRLDATFVWSFPSSGLWSLEATVGDSVDGTPIHVATVDVAGDCRSSAASLRQRGIEANYAAVGFLGTASCLVALLCAHLLPARRNG